jgi:hypothetical protein
MKPRDQQGEIVDPKPKSPYQRPELKRLGTLRDITAITVASPGLDLDESGQ